MYFNETDAQDAARLIRAKGYGGPNHSLTALVRMVLEDVAGLQEQLAAAVDKDIEAIEGRG